MSTNTEETPEETSPEQAPETVETDETPAEAPEGTEAPEELTEAPEAEEEEPETFPREYVEKLRKENADNRVKAKTADDLAARLHTALVQQTGRLADPSDLPFNSEHLDEPETLTAAIDDLLARKAHLASRTPRGDIGQGHTSDADDGFSLAGILRGNAR